MIHYHGTPCGAERKEAAAFLSGRHALIPFPRPEDIGTAAEVCQSFCLDNGAFTAWKSGEPITDWGPYYDWVAKWCNHPAFDFAIVPDVIDGDEAANDRLLREWPFTDGTGVPVWHMHESIDRLWKLCRSRRWHRVALGSSGEYATVGTRKWWERMAEAMDALFPNPVSGPFPKVKLHGLRMLDPAIFHRLPLASADSTNAVRNSSSYERFGMYCPPAAGARMSIIADRIEAHQSAATWVPMAKQSVLAFCGDELKF
jgi:hypothetical protein